VNRIIVNLKDPINPVDLGRCPVSAAREKVAHLRGIKPRGLETWNPAEPVGRDHFVGVVIEQDVHH
jgi:hypothetical protein